VFIAPSGDHYVTRLTHTLEVSQIARTISRALNINEDLTEAISLGHDLGHTPFGHTGEEVLDNLYSEGFRHNEQSLRVVDQLEHDGQGLNLTWEVRDGILNHSKAQNSIMNHGCSQPSTLEGEVCRIADAVAYINHDITDAIRAGLITESELPPAAVKKLGNHHSTRINTMICDIIKNSWPSNRNDTKGYMPRVQMSVPIVKASNLMRDFLFANVYEKRNNKTEIAREIIEKLYFFFIENESKMPLEFCGDEPVERRVVDYIAGMTDHYAIRMVDELKLIKFGKLHL
jgi:dGTPase